MQRAVLRTGDDAPDERHASWLELFFDLVFVVAVAQLGNNLSHDHSATGYLHFLILFAAVWWAWIEYTFHADRFETDDALFRVMTGAVMLTVIILAINITTAFSGNADGFALSYVAVQGSILLLYGWVLVTLPEVRTLAARYMTGFGLCAALFLVSTTLDSPANYILWGAGLLCAIATPFVSVRVIQRTPIHAAHIPERFGLFTMIVLGEAILSVAVGTSATDWGLKGAFVGVLGFICAGCLWWVYFDFVDGEATISRSALGRLLYTTAHLPLLAGLVAFGIGVKLAILHAGAPELADSVRWALCGGVAAFLVAQTLMHMTDTEGFDDLAVWARAIAAAALVALGAFGSQMGALGLLVMITAVLVVELIVEIIDSTSHHHHHHQIT